LERNARGNTGPPGGAPLLRYRKQAKSVHTARLASCPAANFVLLIADCSSDGTT